MANCGRELGLFNGRAARHALRCGFAVARVARKNKSPGFSAEAFITLHLKPSPGRADRAHPGRHGHRRHHRGCPSCARHPAARLAGARIAARGNCAGVHRHRRRRTNAADARQSPDHRHRADASHGGLRRRVAALAARPGPAAIAAGSGSCADVRRQNRSGRSPGGCSIANGSRHCRRGSSAHCLAQSWSCR